VRKGKGSFTLANSVTLFRLCLVPVFVYVLVGRGDRTAAFAIFILMALSDAADGLIARMLGETSLLGSILDPLADKVMLFCAYVLLSRSCCDFTPAIPDWLALGVVGRDVFIVVGVISIKLLTGAIRIKPSLLGKTCTFAQVMTVALVLWGAPAPGALRAAFAIAGFLTLSSAIEYTLLGAAQLREPVSPAL